MKEQKRYGRIAITTPERLLKKAQAMRTQMYGTPYMYLCAFQVHGKRMSGQYVCLTDDERDMVYKIVERAIARIDDEDDKTK